MGPAAAMGTGDAVLLGILQGVTEFLPVSSSGHLVLAQEMLGWKEPELAFDVLLHLGTLLSIFVVFRREIAGMLSGLFQGREGWRTSAGLRLLLLVCLGFVPTAVIALPAHKYIEPLFGSPFAVGIALAGTASVLASTALRSRPPEGAVPRADVGVREALIIGAVQGVAAIPGLSRSGTTIAAGLLLGIEGGTAARFSFLLAIPAILGAAVVEGASNLSEVPRLLAPGPLAGVAAAALAGIVAALAVVRTARAGRIWWFSPYCLAAGLGAIIYSRWGAEAAGSPELRRLAMNSIAAVRHLP